MSHRRDTFRSRGRGVARSRRGRMVARSWGREVVDSRGRGVARSLGLGEVTRSRGRSELARSRGGVIVRSRDR